MDDSTFRLLSAELRNEIYDLASMTPGGIFIQLVLDGPPLTPLERLIDMPRAYSWQLQACHPHPLALTAVCREMRAETLGAFIAVNSVSLIVPILDPNFEAHMQCMPPWKCALKVRDWVHALDSVSRRELKTLEIDIGTWSLANPGYDLVAGALFDIAKALETVGVTAVVWISVANTDPLDPNKTCAVSFQLSLVDVVELRRAVDSVFERHMDELDVAFGAGAFSQEDLDVRQTRLQICFGRLDSMASALEGMLNVCRRYGGK